MVATYDRYGFLLHITNLTDYEYVAHNTENILDEFPQSHMGKLLKVNTVLNAIKIHNRHSKSINILGTTLKYIAGTPDFEIFN